jgi:hypothetical protein
VLNLGKGAWKTGARRRELITHRTSTYTIGSSLADEVVEENGRTYHVYKDGSEFCRKFDGTLLTKLEYMLPNDEV